MAGAKKQKAASPAALRDGDEAASAIFEIGEAQRKLARIDADAAMKIAQLKAEAELQAQPYREQIKVLAQEVKAYCDAHRAALTADGPKAVFASGEAVWRLNPPKVVLADGMEAATVIELLRARGLERLVRVREELNKDAILEEPAAIAGMAELRIEQNESFSIVPFGAAKVAV